MKRASFNNSGGPRAGFSLIELLIVMVIIAVLIGLLLPAIAGARRTTQINEVAAEIQQLDQALTTFKREFNVTPPSSILIPAAGGTWDAASRSKILAIWPKFDFSVRGGLDNNPSPPPAVHLNGAECLVFFLGGIQGPGDVPVMTGFSRNPRQPWALAGENRVGPFFEFGGKGDRFLDIDGDTAIEFADPLPDQVKPYLFISSNGRRYNKTNSATDFDDYDVHPQNGVPPTQANPADMSGLYVQSDGKTPYMNSGYQIISPGFDGEYGVGGAYTEGTALSGARITEQDNITNFSNGELAK